MEILENLYASEDTVEVRFNFEPYAIFDGQLTNWKTGGITTLRNGTKIVGVGVTLDENKTPFFMSPEDFDEFATIFQFVNQEIKNRGGTS